MSNELPDVPDFMKVEPLPGMTDGAKHDVACALVNFAGWLTTLERALNLGSKADIERAEELVLLYIEVNGLPHPSMFGLTRFRHPPVGDAALKKLDNKFGNRIG